MGKPVCGVVGHQQSGELTLLEDSNPNLKPSSLRSHLAPRIVPQLSLQLNPRVSQPLTDPCSQ